MTSSWKLFQSIVLQIIQVTIGSRFLGRCLVTCRNRVKSGTGLLIFWRNVTFRDSPLVPSAPTTSLLCVYNDISSKGDAPSFASPLSPTPSLCPPSSLTHVHRCIGYHNPNRHSLSKSVRRTSQSTRPRSSIFRVHRRRETRVKRIEERRLTRHQNEEVSPCY